MTFRSPDLAEMEFDPHLISYLRKATRAAALTGAGISAESGIPTFRDAQTGLWAKYRPEDLATPEAFQRNPKLVWEWYAMRREKVLHVEPNPGHLALAAMEAHIPNFTLITQNVDGLHRRAGSQNVIELHGSLTRVKCFERGCTVEFEPESWQTGGEAPPRCPKCGGRLRPDVVWFGEMLLPGALESSFQAAVESQAFFSVGTSGLVQPAASLPFAARDAGALVVEINPAETPLTALADYSLRGPAGVVLPELVRAVWEV